MSYKMSDVKNDCTCDICSIDRGFVLRFTSSRVAGRICFVCLERFLRIGIIPEMVEAIANKTDEKPNKLGSQTTFMPLE